MPRKVSTLNSPPLPLDAFAGNTLGMARQSRAPAILLTRPEAQSARLAESLRARHPGLTIVISPLLVPRFLRPEIPAGAQTLILTSETGAQAARQIAALQGGLPKQAFCVGDRTAQVAREAGFEATSAEGDAQALLALIQAQNPTPPLLHLHGRETRGDLAKRLNSAGIETFSVLAYEQNLQPLTPEAVALLQGSAPVIAPIFSPRSGHALAVEYRRISGTAPLFPIAISPAAAGAFQGHDVTISTRPDGEAMLVAISSRLASLNLPPVPH